MQKNKIIILSGPTASGKTFFSLKIAKLINAEIVNFDSLLFYKEISIGTAKPNELELKEVKHHMIGNHSIFHPINAADYIKEAITIINQIHQNDKAVVLTGGSGFYLQALLNGMYDSETTSQEITDRSNTLYQEKGITPFLDELKTVDLESFEKYHMNDHYRIRRAIEHFWMTGDKFSTSRSQLENKSKMSHIKKYQWDTIHLHLDIPKDQHFMVIQKRTDDMFKNGLLDEVTNLIENNGATGSEKPLNSIGYKETIDFIQGRIETIEHCIELINIHTRQLAKAQRTWFKKIDKLSFNSLEESDKILETCLNFIKK